MRTRANLGALQILIFDPDSYMTSLTAYMLSAHGITTFRKASSAKQALDSFSSGHFNVVITGIANPDEQFETFVATLRDPKQSANPRVPIIAYSAMTTLPLVLNAVRAGASLILQRPLSAEVLVDHIKMVTTTTLRFKRQNGLLMPVWPEHLTRLLDAGAPRLVAIDNGREQSVGVELLATKPDRHIVKI